MIVIDPGHHYIADSYDGDRPQEVFFMKRIGDGYPGNEGKPHAGTNIQEEVRVLIHRFKYLDNQVHHKNNAVSIQYLRNVLWLLEDRAAERHGLDFDFVRHTDEIEKLPTCQVCGHITCKGHL